MAIKESFNPRHDLLGHVDEDSIAPNLLVAEELSPTVSVDETSAKAVVIERGETIKIGEATQRNYDGSSNRGQFSTGEKEYTTEHHIWEQTFDRIQNTISKQYYDSEVISAKICDMVIKLGREARVASAYQYTAGYTAIDAGSTIAATAVWTNATNARPWEDVEALSDQAFAVAGIRKDQMKLCMDRQLLGDVMRCDEVVADAKYTKDMQVMGLEAQRTYFRDFLGVGDVIIRDGTYNTAGINGLPSFANIWDKTKAQLVMPPVGGSFQFPGFSRQPAYSKLFGGDRMIDTYWEEANQKHVVRIQEYRGVQTDYQWGVELTGVA